MKNLTLFNRCVLIVFFLTRFNSYCIELKDYPFEHFNADNGLSNNSVNCILQDKKGFLWFGTFDGLNRYDGYKFVIFKYDPDQQNSIGNSRVESLFEDQNGTLWIGLSDGELDKFDRETEAFSRYPLSDSKENMMVSAITQVDSDMIWIKALNRGIFRFNIKSETYVYFPDDRVPKIVLHKLNFPYPTSDIEGLLPTLQKKCVSGELIPCYQKIRDEPYSLSIPYIRTVFQEESGIFWIGTRDGLYRFDAKTKKLTHFTNRINDPSSLSGNNIYSIYKDKSGVLWVGTREQGINKLNVGEKKFHLYTNFGEPSAGLSSNSVRSVYEDRSGLLWIGTGDMGITVLDRKNQRSNFYTTKNIGLSSNEIRTLFQDHRGAMWIGTRYGLNRIEFKNGFPIVKRYTPENTPDLCHPQIYTLCESKPGILWIGTLQGLNKLIIRSGQFVSYREGKESIGISHENVKIIRQDPSGTLWIGTYGGLNKLVENKEGQVSFKHYKHDPQNRNSLSHDIIFSIYAGQKGILWIGTASGLNRFDIGSETFTRFREEDGLPSESVYGVLGDDSGNIWMSTNVGLCRYNPKENSYRIFDTSDHLQGREFAEDAYYKSRSGELFFGGVNGLNSFYPDQLKDNPYIPNVVITDFKLFNKSVSIGKTESGQTILDKTISETNHLLLSYKYNVLSFEFAALHFASPNKNQYSYILEGFEKRWNYTDSQRRYATYTNLDPGEYVFKVKASNNDGIWNNEGISLKVVIRPPFWRTLWAYFIYGIFCVLLVYGVYRYSSMRIHERHKLTLAQMEKERIEELTQMKSRFFTNISHEIRTPLSLILAPIENILVSQEVSQETKQHLGLIARNTQRLHHLIDKLMILGKLEENKIDLRARKGNIVEFIKNISMAFEEMAQKYQMEYQFQTAVPSLEIWFDPDLLEEMIDNLLSNAFKFTPHGGKITLRISKVVLDGTISREGNPPPGSIQKYVEIDVQDNGQGMTQEEMEHIFDRFYQSPKKSSGAGIGMNLTRSLVLLHKGKMTVESKPDQGSSFRIFLPLGDSHLTPDQMVSEPIDYQDYSVNVDDFHFLDKDQVPAEKMSEPFREDNNKPSILIVEDNKDLRNYLYSMLEKQYKVEICHNGLKGFQKASTWMPDLIISDVMMPEMGGIELVEKLKNDVRTSHIPVILLTVLSSMEHQLDGLRKGADVYISKPFHPKHLEIQVEKLIETRRKLRERFKMEILLNPQEIQIESVNDQFLKRCMEMIEASIADEKFGVEVLGEKLHLNRVHLYRKIKSLVGLSPKKLIDSIRMKRAVQLLQQRKLTVAEISYLLGFKEPSTFSYAFRKYFGKPPLDYLSNTLLKNSGETN